MYHNVSSCIIMYCFGGFMETELIRLKKISENTSLSVRLLRQLIIKGKLKAVSINGIYYVRKSDYEEFMFNLECQRLGLLPEDVKKYLKQDSEKELLNIINTLN